MDGYTRRRYGGREERNRDGDDDRGRFDREERRYRRHHQRRSRSRSRSGSPAGDRYPQRRRRERSRSQERPESFKHTGRSTDRGALGRDAQYKVFVGNLPFDTSEEELRGMFEPSGRILSLALPLDTSAAADNDVRPPALDGSAAPPPPPRIRGFAFISFGSASEAAAACMLTGTTLRSRKLRVDVATDSRSNRSSGPGAPPRTTSADGLPRAPPPPASDTRHRQAPNRAEGEQKYTWGRPAPSVEAGDAPPSGSAAAPAPAEKPSFEASGFLGKSDRVSLGGGTELKFEEPQDAKKPTRRWRLYVFKNGEPMLRDNDGHYKIHRKSVYLFGRDRAVADIPVDHPSCSKQHAVLQYRRTAGAAAPRPYLMDLESVNGSFLNGERVEARRYYELLEQDMIKFGTSSREYVLLHDDSSGANLDNDELAVGG